jgi:hypothetical protein
MDVNYIRTPDVFSVICETEMHNLHPLRITMFSISRSWQYFHGACDHERDIQRGGYEA